MVSTSTQEFHEELSQLIQQHEKAGVGPEQIAEILLLQSDRMLSKTDSRRLETESSLLKQQV